jgi:hypothetical protein
VGVPWWHVAIHFRNALCRLRHWHGHQIYIFGDVSTIPNPDIELTVRVHDECNGSDVFGSDICTCRPYLIHGIEECIRTAQKGGCVAYDGVRRPVTSCDVVCVPGCALAADSVCLLTGVCVRAVCVRTYVVSGAAVRASSSTSARRAVLWAR